MNRQRNRDGQRDGPSRRDTAQTPDAPRAGRGHGGDPRRDRLDTLEWADDRTADFDPDRGGVDQDPIDDLLEGRQADADYRDEARRVTPTLGPEDPADDRGGG
jgi:hypothetical protein